MMTLRSLLLALLLTGCGAEAEKTSSTTNAEFKLQKLFDAPDGCTAFRFKDGSARTVYYVRCPHSDVTASEEHSERHGKRTHTEYTDSTTVER